MEKYRIEVDHCRDINGLIVEKEELIPDVCNWSAELDDYYYRMKDSLLTYDKDKILEAQKEYKKHFSKIWDFINLGCKVITK